MQKKVFPPPNQFSHELTKDEAYYLQSPGQMSPPDGTFKVGTKVLLYKYDKQSYCYVISDEGIMAQIPYSSLKAIKA